MTVFPWQLQSWLRLLVQDREPREQEEQEQWQKPMHKQKKLPPPSHLQLQLRRQPRRWIIQIAALSAPRSGHDQL